MKHGFLFIDKPIGPTSHDCVSMVRKALSEKKVGHLGTLDPAASGLLVVAVGAKALKVIELFHNLSKEYEADIYFGAVSTTYDREGTIEERAPKPGWVVPEKLEVRRVIDDQFVGTINQVPPGYSAINIGGERAYRKMRQGKGVNLPPRAVHITSCDILSYDYPHISLHVHSSSGTYIRSLAHDLGRVLRCGGYLEGLRRTKVGDWSINQSVALDDVTFSDVVPLKEILGTLERIDVTKEEADDISHGRNIEREVKVNTFAWFHDLPIAILEPAKDGSRQAHARKVL